MFTLEDRDRVRDHVLELAASDPRVVAGAVVGSLAYDQGDRWSDVDLTFAVADGVPVAEVLADWTRRVVDELEAVHLFDLPSGATIYRVFLLPGCLQLDLSFTPAPQFGAGGPKFRLLFGSVVEKPHAAPPPAHELFGLAAHHAMRARFSVERGRYWQAAYLIDVVREHALSLACRRRALPARYGRGFDDLPVDLLDTFGGTLVRSTEPEELLRALDRAVAALLQEAEEAADLAEQVEPYLREVTSGWSS